MYIPGAFYNTMTSEEYFKWAFPGTLGPEETAELIEQLNKGTHIEIEERE